jgi:hypothetical protein
MRAFALSRQSARPASRKAAQRSPAGVMVLRERLGNAGMVRALRALHAPVDLPAGGQGAGDVVDVPGGPGPQGPPLVLRETDSCDQPRSMEKVTSGSFKGGLTMDTYFPWLSGKGFWQHGGTAGPFDTGSRAGANVQLFGVVPSPCQPGQYTFGQTITRTRFRINGAVHSEEGKTFDDIAKSGLDQSKPTFRQTFLGGGDAPMGLIISIADPPSTPYGATDTIEHDRDFVTSLSGPGGTKSVSWSLSTRITSGKVTKNDLT